MFAGITSLPQACCSLFHGYTARLASISSTVLVTKPKSASWPTASSVFAYQQPQLGKSDNTSSSASYPSTSMLSPFIHSRHALSRPRTALSKRRTQSWSCTFALKEALPPDSLVMLSCSLTKRSESCLTVLTEASRHKRFRVALGSSSSLEDQALGGCCQ